MTQIYEHLTGINIEQEKAIWDDRGKGYYGEYLVLSELYKKLPGSCKILMNLNIPVNASKTTEIDLLLIHETGLYVFEIKHYKGTIYGKDDDENWTQYFRTAKNNVFRNPINQNAYHMRALQALFPDIPIRSVIVFTDDECVIKVENKNQYIDICTLNNVINILQKRFSYQKNILSLNDVDKTFSDLIKYSPIKKPVTINSKTVPAYEWIELLIKDLENEKEKIKIEAELYLTNIETEKRRFVSNIEEDNKKIVDKLTKEKSEYKKRKRNCIIVSVIFMILCILFSNSTISKNKAKFEEEKQQYVAEMEKTNRQYANELESFKQNFLHVDEIDNEFIDDLASYVEVSNVSILPLSDDAVTFNATLTLLVDAYSVPFSSNSKYIVMTTSGKVFEYDYLDSGQYFYPTINKLADYQPSKKISDKVFYGISNPDEITYIKLTDISLKESGGSTIKNNLEIELYSKE